MLDRYLGCPFETPSQEEAEPRPWWWNILVGRAVTKHRCLVALARSVFSPPETKETPPESKATIVLSDTDNDVQCIKANLNFAGICNRQGHWKEGVKNVKIVHTGDWLSKNNPNPGVVDFLNELNSSAPETCEVVLLNGNHEIEGLVGEEGRKKTKLSKAQIAFIKQQDFLHIADGILYMHGYPRLELIQVLIQLRDEGVEDLNVFNEKFRKPFYQGVRALYTEDSGLAMIGDFDKVKTYYQSKTEECQTHGQKVSHLLTMLGIHTVIHGHKPQKTGEQLDGEFKEEIPNIRMINNDIQVKDNRWGCTMIRGEGASQEIIFHNNTKRGPTKKEAKKFMGTQKKDRDFSI